MKPQWLEKLEQSLIKNQHWPQAKYVQLATIRPDGRPANRTLVFRKFYDSSLLFITDKRSEKVEQFLQGTWAEACWYLPETREQFRLLGQCKVIDRSDDPFDLCSEIWQHLSGAAKQMFSWPVPGKILDSLDFFQQPVPEIPDNFVVLVLQLVQVELLDLTPSPHQRTRYQLLNGVWHDERINP